MDGFALKHTSIEGLYVIEAMIYKDKRGYFTETYREDRFHSLGLNMKFVQENESKSKRGVLRGLHYQSKYSQGKLVRVIKGGVFDVAVDLRQNSPTFGKWEGIYLSEHNKKQFYIPKGFAHGFLVLSDEAILQYKCSDYYAPEYECGIIWNDSEINIKWPLEQIDEIILSDKDEKHPNLKECLEKGILIK